MRAVVCTELGPLEGLKLTDVDPPTAGPGRVVVAIEAAGVNFVDTVIATGGYQFAPPLPYIPGSEVAGTIVEIGSPEGSAFAVGDAVVCSVGVGGFAERVAVPAAGLIRRPPSVDVAVAATVLQSYSTAVFALTRRDHVVAGDKVLVLGAGGGVGLAVVDVATSLGAEVIAVASSPAKRAAATAAGAVATIDPGTEDLKTRARELGGGGVDVVVDPVGGALAEPALRALGFGGRYLVVGFAAGAIPRVPLNLVLLNSRTVIGIEWGGWLLHHPEQGALVAGEIFEAIADGTYRPAAPEVRPLAEAVSALVDVAGRRVTGKIALVP